MYRMCRSGASLVLIVGLSIAGAAIPAQTTGGEPAGEPLSVMVTAATDDSGARVTLTFSRRVSYRLEESRSRLRVVLSEPVLESSMVDSDIESDVVKRVRFDQTSKGTDIVFYLGRAFATFSSTEQNDPFRVTFQFQREGVMPPPAVMAPSGAETPSGSPEPAPVTPRDDSTPLTRRVVLDPGHGGDESGAVSRSGLKEKDLALDIARRVRARLQDSGFSVALTRDEDQSLGLTDRTALANQAGAGLFVSIHANSSTRSTARGAEVYFLSRGTAGDEQALSVARHESFVSFGEPDPGDEASRSEIRAVLWDMAQAAFLTASSRLAVMIQTEMNALSGIKERGVKQAPFRVLLGATMPAVLVEVGFLTNDDEERKLASPDYRDQIAQALAAAVHQFTQERERQEGASR